MNLASLIGRCKRRRFPLFEHTLCVDFLFAGKCDRLGDFSTMNVNISNEFNFSVVHGAMNRSGSLAKLT